MEFEIWAIRIAVILFAVTIHEYAHGKAALSLGDPTAKNAGRLTLNPLSHLDPVGTVFLLFFHFGWAKPVPVDTRYFTHRKRDTILMALSGPVSNLAAAAVIGIFIRYYNINWEIYRFIMIYALLINIGLGLFNLIPIPPLDGSHVLENILPEKAMYRFYKIRRYAPSVLMGILIIDFFLNLHIFGRLLSSPIYEIAELMGGKNFEHLRRIYGF